MALIEMVDYASDLGGSIDPLVVDELKQAQIEMAKQVLGNFSPDIGGDGATLRSVADFARQLDDSEEIFPGLEEVEGFISDIDDYRYEEYRESRFESRDAEFEVDSLMRGLAPEV